MPRTDKKTYKLSIYLLKEDIKSYKDALKENISVQAKLSFNSEVTVGGSVIIGATKKNPSSWRDLIQEGVDEDLPELDNFSNRAVVFFDIDNRIFVIVFGYGKHLIKPESIDTDFGLRTVLNIVNPEKLLSIDKANLDELTVLTRTQTSRKSRPEIFDIDVIKDLLRGITGEPDPGFDIRFGKVITGSEGISIIPRVKFIEIPESLKELLRAYNSDKYKASFGWIDNLKHEVDPIIIESLREKLIESLKRNYLLPSFRPMVNKYKLSIMMMIM